MVHPPAPTRVWPVIMAASSEARNAKAEPTSEGSTNRPTGIIASIFGPYTGSSRRLRARSVMAKVGATTLTVMPVGAQS